MNSMKKCIFYSIAGVALITACIFSIFTSIMLHQQFYSHEQANIKIEANHIKQLILSMGEKIDVKLITSSNRVTIIQKDGRVLFDNLEDSMKMDNHSNRPEIQALQDNPEGESTRFSETLGQQTYYYAIPIDASTVLRLSITMDSIYAMIIKTVPYFIVITLAVFLLAMYLSRQLSRKIITPLYDIKEQTYDELDLFYKKISKQKSLLKKQKNELRQKTEEFNIITQNIADGLIILNANYEIISINQKAIKILGRKGKDYISKNIMELNRIEELRISISKAYNGENSEVIIPIDHKQYSLFIAPIYRKNLVKGVVILAMDQTQKAENEKMRKEFSANVSHELKTPLTSISGYAELIKTGIAKQEDIQLFSEKIYDEAQTLITLIDDIIQISKMDEEKKIQDKETLNLKQLLETSIARLEMLAEQSNVEIKAYLEDLEYLGILSVLQETFYNVIENAIKYNVSGGRVIVRLTQKENGIVITIEDTGIGIPEECKERIFERFYRVDTSHSSNINGTGLGLSIVKHGVNVHKGTISVESELSIGTKIEIVLFTD